MTSPLRNVLKPVAWALIFTFSYSQILYASDLKQFLPGPQTLLQNEGAQSNHQALVDQQNTLHALSGPIVSHGPDDLPEWLLEESGGWLSNLQLETLRRNDRDLLNRLALLSQSQDRFITARPDGTEALYVDGRLIVVRDVQNDLLWEPVFDSDQKAKDGTLLLADGTLQVIQAGHLTRQVTSAGAETTYGTDGRMQSQITPEGSRTDYRYTFKPDGTLAGTTRTTSSPSGNFIDQFDSAGVWTQTTTPDGVVETKLTGSPARIRITEPFLAATPRDFRLTAGTAVTQGILSLTGNGQNQNVNAVYLPVLNRSQTETSVTFPFIVGAADSQTTLSLSGLGARGAVRQIDFFHTGSKLVIRTLEGTKLTTRVTAVSSLTLNTRYFAKFVITTGGTSLYVWKEGQTQPTRAAYTWTLTDWQPTLKMVVKKGSLKIDELTLIKPQTIPRANLDLSKLFVPGGLWKNARWPVTPDVLPPTGSVVTPGLVNKREITLDLSATDPSASDGTSGSGLKAMQFSLDNGQTWSVSEPFSNVKNVTLPQSDGIYNIQTRFQDRAGNWSLPNTTRVTLDTVAPVISFSSQTLTNNQDYTLTYLVDGVEKTESVRLQEGENVLTRSVSDLAGNPSSAALTVTLDTTPPVLTLGSPAETNAERYSAVIQADGKNQSVETWLLGRGAHQLITQVADEMGNAAQARLAVLRIGALPEPKDPPATESSADGQRLTQTLSDGSIATYIEGKLVSVTTTDGTKLIGPSFDDTGKLTGGWLITPDGSTTFLENGTTVWSKDTAGLITWYFSDGRVEAQGTASEISAAYAYQLDDQDHVLATLLTTQDASTLLDPKGRILHQLKQNGQWVHYDRSTNPDGSLRLTRPDDSGVDLPLAMTYVEEDLREVTQNDGTVIRFQNGIPAQIIQPDGTSTSISIEESHKILSGLSVVRNGITRKYDTSGRLTSLQLTDGSKLSVESESLTSLGLPDGTQIRNGDYDAENHLVSGTVITPDGREVTYADQKPVEARLPDGTRITYGTDGKPNRLQLSGGLTYTLTFSVPSWEARLNEENLGANNRSSETLTKLIYSEEWVLQEATRVDGATLAYRDGRLHALTQKDGVVISYSYDDTNRLASTLATSPDPTQAAVRSEYAYDKIRKVFKADKLIFEYTYEFSAEAAEITVMREVETGITKRYRDGLLISQTDPDGAVTTYEYAADSIGNSDPFETAVGAVQTLPDGTVAEYESLKLKELLLTNGSRLLLTDGKITGVIHPDGTMEEGLDASNLLGNFGALEDWSNGSAHSPDGWDPSVDIGAAIVQETSPVNVHSGTSSVRLSTGPGGGDAAPFRNIVPFGNKEALAKYEGKTVTLGAWVKTGDPGASLAILDDVASSSRSSYHPGDGQWHFLTVTHTVGRDIMKLQAFLLTSGVNTTAYFDDAVFVVGPEILAHDFSSLVKKADLPTGRAALRRMVDQKALTLVQPDALDRSIQSAVGAVQTLSDGTMAMYESFKLKELLLTNGSRLLLTDGKITGVIHPDGTMEAGLDASNLLGNFGALEDWSNGATHAPDGWQPSLDIGAAIAKENSPQNIHSGSHSVKLTTGPGGGDSCLYRDLAPFGNKEELAKYEGKTVTLGAWVKTGDPGASIVLHDDVMAPSRSAYHPGDGKWHFLTVTHTVGRDIMKLRSYLLSSGVNTIAYFDSATFVVGPEILAHDFSSLVKKADLPTGRTALRRMVDQGTLTLVQPEPRAPEQALTSAPSASPVLARTTVTYQGKVRETFTYRYKNDLTVITDSIGTIRTYDAANRLIEIEKSDGTRYEVSYDRDLSESQAARIAALHNDDPEILRILQNPNGDQVITHRLTRLALPDGSVIASNFPAETVLEQEFDEAGNLISRMQANNQVTLYENNRPVRAYDLSGNLATTFEYDSAEHLVKIMLVAARRELTEQIEKLKAEIPVRRSQALEELARQRGAAVDQVATQFSSGRSELQSQFSTLENQLRSLEGTNVHGKKAKKQKSQTMDQIRGAMNQVRAAQSNVEQQYAQALGNLEAQVESVRQQIETESIQALSNIEVQSGELQRQLLRQEISSILVSAYRSAIGRDPSEQEFQEEVQRLYDRYGSDPSAAVDLNELTQRIRSRPDYADRVAQVAAIKEQVSAWLTRYSSLSESEAAGTLSALGLASSEVVPLSVSDVERILVWLNSRSLHFGHSAFLALQEYLASQGIRANAVALAVEAILTDILVGVINPKANHEADLELSLFALQRIARLHGASATPVKVSFEDLRSMLSDPVVENTFTAFNPRTVVFSPNGQKIYVTQSADPNNNDLRALAEIDAVTHATLRTLTFPGERWTYTNVSAASPDGRWLAVGTVSAGYEPDQRLFLVDAATFTVAATFEGFRGVSSIIFSEDGGWLYAADNRGMNGSGVAVIDLTKKELSTKWNLPDGVAPTSIAVSPSGGRLYVTTESSNLLAILNTADGTARLLHDIPPARYAAFHPNGRDLYLVHHTNDSVSVFDTSTETITGNVHTSYGPSAIAFSPDGSKAYVTSHYLGEVTFIDTLSRTAILTKKIGQGLSHLAVDRSGQHAIVVDNGGSKLITLELPNPVIAHVSGNHYILVTSIAADGTVTYREPNAGGDGETLTMTQAEFQKIWEGNILSSRAPPHAWQVLADREAQAITGSFWPLFFAFGLVIGFFHNQIANVLESIAIWINDYLANTFPLLGPALNTFATFLRGDFKEGFKQLGKLAIQAAIETASMALAFVAGGPVGAAIYVASRTVSGALLDAGVDPKIANAVGIVVGSFNPAHPVISVLAAAARVGANLALANNNVHPVLAIIANVGINIVSNAFTQGVDIKTLSNGATVTWHATGFEALGHVLSTQLLPTLAGELAIYGATRLGESVGLDARISQLIGTTLRNGIHAIASPGGTAKAALDSMWDGLKKGALQIGIQTIGEEAGLSPLVSALSARALTNAISAGLNPHTNIIEELGRTFVDTMKNFVTSLKKQFDSPEGVIEFSHLLENHTLGEILEQRLTSLLEADAVESVWKAGGIASILSRQTRFVELNGRSLKEVTINDKTTFYFNAVSDNLEGRRVGDYLEWGTFVRGEDDKFYLWRGKKIVDFEFARTEVLVENGTAIGGAVKWLINGEEQSLLIKSAPGSPSVEFGAGGTIKEGVIENGLTGVKVVINDGVIHQLIVPNPDNPVFSEDVLGKIDVSNIPPEEFFKLIKYGVGNGVGNPGKEGVLPGNIQKFLDDLARETDPGFVMPLSLYEEGNFITDSLTWLLDSLGTNVLTNEVRYKLDAELMARGSLPPTRLVYSGNFQPLLRAIEKENYDINTIVVVGGPTTMDDRIPDQVKRIVYVVGEDDIVPFVNRTPHFKHAGPNGSEVETIIVRMKNSAGTLKHTDYFQWENDTNPYHAISHEFLLELTKSSPLGMNPGGFLAGLGIQPVNGVYNVDIGDTEFETVLNAYRHPHPRGQIFS